MTKLFQFFSIAMLTQVFLALSQLVLLPIQIRMWGHEAIAAWYSAIAIAMLSTIADFGLRTAGHVELIRFAGNREDLAAGEWVKHLWGWIRTLVFAFTVATIVGDAVVTAGLRHLPYPTWKACLIVAYSLETLLTVRIVYLDSLGFYRGAEAGYCMFAAIRLVLSVPALLFLHFEANGLAWLYLATSVIALLLQERLCRKTGVLGLFAALPNRLAIRVLAIARYTLAEPCANWVRLSLPVLVIASFGSPAAVTAYVALRAAFGGARITVQQLSRFASVEYLRMMASFKAGANETLLCVSVLGASIVGTALASLLIVDNLRLLGLWLTHCDRTMFQMTVLSFGLSAPFYPYLVLSNLMFRMGELSAVAQRQYAYVCYSALFGAVAVKAGFLPLYLGLLVLAEVLLSISFLLPRHGRNVAFQTTAGRRGLVAAATGTALVCVLWFVVRANEYSIFTATVHSSEAWSSLLAFFAVLAFTILMIVINSDLIRSAPSVFQRSADRRSSLLAEL